ncbi:MAG: HIT domain-containing protein, partial [Anaeroplasmataceae bacterium]|nr:HIT domain-containing protein [Anaeroplasmataceae bacterium]
MSCVFCKILSGELPSYKIYEDEYTYAFLDIAKDVDGHTVVIPKKHVTNILDCDTETLSKVAEVIRLISKHYVEDLGYDGVNVLNASGSAAE